MPRTDGNRPVVSVRSPVDSCRVTVQPAGTVTLLFSDVEGSTRLLVQLGAERYAEVLEEHRRLLRNTFATYAGYEVGTEGDSFFVTFQRAGDAVAAAGEAQQALATARWPDGVELRVRMAVHTGEPIVVDSNYVGMDVHRAARIMAAAHGGQVLVSAATVALLDGVPVRDLGPHRLKDLLEPIRLYQLEVAGLPGEFPPLRSLHQTNLPLAAWPLLGRERELERIRAFVSEKVRLVTLTGPGGSGKTRLALQAAAEVSDEFPDGVFFVALAPLRNTSMVLPTVAEAAGLQPDDDLVGWLRSRRMLLVLDNLEHLQEVASVVSELLAGETMIVATSRTPLRLTIEHELAVDPLPDDAAVELFVSRAAAAGRDVEADETVAAVCRRLDNLPLALELAAARAKLLSPSLLLQRLDAALPLLTGGGSDRPERQRTLRATIEWSHDLLDAGARAAFRRMSVFRGSFTLAAAEAITDAQLDQLAALLDQSLIKPRGDERFFLLETLREYAAEQLDAAGETATYALRHAHWYLERLEEHHPEMRGPHRSDSLAWFVAEEDNLRAMLDRLIADAAAEAAEAAALLHRWWVARNAYVEPRQRFTELLARDDVSDQLRVRLLLCLGTVEARVGNQYATEAAAREILELAEPGSMDYAQAFSLLAHAAMDRGEIEEAVDLGAQAVEAAKSLDDRTRAQIGSDIGEILAEGGRTEEARAIARETREVFLQNHDEVFAAVCDFVLGRYDLYEHKYESAHETLVSALATIRRLGGHRGYEAETLRYLGFALLGLGRRADACASSTEALEIAFADNPAPTREVIDALGQVALTADSTDAADAARLRAAVANLRRATMPFGLPRLAELEREFERRLIETLGSELWARERATGAALTLDDAVALARSLGQLSGPSAPR
jgi:predicted ATPase/class 3 adenylate cyclase